jgi:heat shock protein HslJ
VKRGSVPLALFALVLTACGSAGGDTAGTGLALERTPWTLQSYDEDGAPVEVAEGVVVTALFDEGQVSGSGGCNRYSAGYTRDGDSLTIDPVASTLMACPEPASSVEAAFLAALARTAAYSTDATTLTLSDTDGATLLTFAEADQAALLGPTWSATGINNGSEAVTSLVADSEVTAVFGDDGTVSGSAGCNTYSGTFTQDGPAITIGPLASTLKACADPDLGTQETQFLAAMERATEYRIDGTTLELRDDSGALQASFQGAATAG